MAVALAVPGAAPARAQETPAAVAAHAGTRKVVVSKSDLPAVEAAAALPARLVIDYPDRSVFVVEAAALAQLAPEKRKLLRVRDDLDRIDLRGRSLTTTAPLPPVPRDLALVVANRPQLYLFQFAGPVKQE